ncbi:MAG: hypothetical protein GY828_06430 [Candidatus Gracilibacteria bacterium]|nr:hypothetical protein [Candidatus Gracilibacteria bacterium]
MLFSLIVLFLIGFSIIGLVLFYSLEINSHLKILGLTLLTGLPILGASIGIGFLGKDLFNFIYSMIIKDNISEKGCLFFKMFLFIILSFILVYGMHLGSIYSLVVYFQLTSETLFSNEVILGSGLLIGGAGLGFGIGLSKVTSGILLYIEKLFRSKDITPAKKIKYTILNILFYVLLFNLVSLPLLLNLIFNFQIMSIDDIDGELYIKLGFTAGMLAGIISILQGKVFLNYHKYGKNIFLTIGGFILSIIVAIISLAISYRVLF